VTPSFHFPLSADDPDRPRHRTSPAELVASKGPPEPKRRRFASRARRRLGPMEYTLLALIILGVAITIAMAIVNP
jgi:hypothetical protein